MREAVNLRKAETGSLADRLGGEEGIEYLAQNVIRNSDTGILNPDQDPVGLLVFRGNGDNAAVRHRVPGIDDQIDQRRFKLREIRDHRPYGILDIELQRDGISEAAVEDVAQRRDPPGKVDRLGIDALPPRKCQQLAGQRRGALGSRLDCTEGFETRIGRQVLLDAMNVARNDHQEIVEVMRDAAGQLAKRIHLLGFGQLSLHLFEL